MNLNHRLNQVNEVRDNDDNSSSQEKRLFVRGAVKNPFLLSPLTLKEKVTFLEFKKKMNYHVHCSSQTKADKCNYIRKNKKNQAERERTAEIPKISNQKK